MTSHLNRSIQMFGSLEHVVGIKTVLFVKVKYYHQVFTFVLHKDNDNGVLTLHWRYLYDQQHTLLHRKGSNSNYLRIFPPEQKCKDIS